MIEPPDEDQDRLLGSISLVALTVIFTSLVWYIGGTYQTETVRTLLEASVSIILTGVVALIYYRQWRAESEQADIARAQRDIADAMKDFQSRPALDVVDKKPVKYGWKIYLGNFGFGPAHGLELEVNLQTSVEGYAIKSTTVQLVKQFEDSESDHISANAILPESVAELFLAKSIDVELRDSESISLSTLFEELVIHGDTSDTIKIDLTVSGVDAFGTEYTCDAGEYSIVIDDIEGVSEYHVNNVVAFERN